ncbi:15495_t:CDS:2 [Entrophospora sp. SA101]|nr:15495_t:CDS:2 [Entrophospora sp. SA101]
MIHELVACESYQLGIGTWDFCVDPAYGGRPAYVKIDSLPSHVLPMEIGSRIISGWTDSGMYMVILGLWKLFGALNRNWKHFVATACESYQLGYLIGYQPWVSDSEWVFQT